MKRWGVARNDYYCTGAVYLDEAPWYVFVIEGMAERLCGVFPAIPLPKIKFCPKGETEQYTWKDWYGDTQQIFHVWVCEPITSWCDKRTKTDYVEVPYFYLKGKFPQAWDGEDKIEVADGRTEAATKTSESFNRFMRKEARDVEKRISLLTGKDAE